MLPILFAVLPIFFVILLGYLSVSRKLLSRDFWAEAERLVFYLLFPALLLGASATAPLGRLTLLPLALATFASIGAMSLGLILLRRWITQDGPSFTSLFQGATRQNSYLCFAVALALLGETGVEAVAIAVAVYVPFVNVLSVVVLLRYGGKAGMSAGRIILAVFKNPLLLAIMIGLVLNVSGLGLHHSLGQMLQILGQAALCLGLMAVGAGLDLPAARRSGGLVGLALVLKLAVLPALAFGAAQLFGVDAAATFALVLLAGSPTAGAAYIMARQMGGNAPLVAAIITAQVAVALFTLPILLGLLDPLSAGSL
ncbi:MAG: AEC family transporter [Pseudomonadota bacterium]